MSKGIKTYLLSYATNNGNWGGCNSQEILFDATGNAHSKEIADEYLAWKKSRLNSGTDMWVKCLTEYEDILSKKVTDFPINDHSKLPEKLKKCNFRMF